MGLKFKSNRHQIIPFMYVDNCIWQKMTKDQNTIIPEDLYNLTQLAELAAGRLTTTETKETKCDRSLGAPPIDATSIGRQQCMTVEKPDVQMKDISSQEHQIKQTQTKHRSSLLLLNFEMAQSRVKTQNRSPSSETHYNYQHITQHHSRLPENTVTEECSHNKQIFNPPPTNSNKMHTSCTLTCSSSDDDSNYYSHKVFDRKKLRRSTISDSMNSPRYDDNSSCSSNAGGISCSSTNSIISIINDEDQSSSSSQYHSYADVKFPTIDGHNDKFSTHHSSEDPMNCNLGLLDDEHSCPECGKKYSTSSNLARHRQTHR